MSENDVRDALERALYDFVEFWRWLLVPIIVLICCEKYRNIGVAVAPLSLYTAAAGWLTAPFIPVIALISSFPNLTSWIILAPVFAIWLPTLVNALAGSRVIAGWNVALLLSLVAIGYHIQDGLQKPGGHFG